MDKTMQRKVEERLYRHFRRVRQLERFERALMATRERITVLEDRIRNCHHTIENPLKSPSFEGVPGGVAGESPIEKALMKAYEKMERELGRFYERQADLVVAVNKISEETELMGLIVGDLAEVDRQIIELRYNQRHSFRQMEDMLFMDHVSLHRSKDRVLGWVWEELAELEAMEKSTAGAVL